MDEMISLPPPMPQLLLVDGSNLLFQMYYGMPSRIVNKNGIAIHGVLGFIGALLKIIRMTSPTHIAVLFDGEHENERALIDEDYKANRPDYSQMPEEDTPFGQLPYIHQALELLGIHYAETTACETDDWIAAYVHTYEKDARIFISSFDSDYFQLISDHVSVLRYRGDRTLICTPAYIREKLGIEPHQYVDFKSLTGDPSDNIRGADKIGPKTAAALLRNYRDLTSVIASAQSIARPSVRASIISSTERLLKNRQLISLQYKVPLPFSLENLSYASTGMTTRDVLTHIGL